MGVGWLAAAPATRGLGLIHPAVPLRQPPPSGMRPSFFTSTCTSSPGCSVRIRRITQPPCAVPLDSSTLASEAHLIGGWLARRDDPNRLVAGSRWRLPRTCATATGAGRRRAHCVPTTVDTDGHRSVVAANAAAS